MRIEGQHVRIRAPSSVCLRIRVELTPQCCTELGQITPQPAAKSVHWVCWALSRLLPLERYSINALMNALSCGIRLNENRLETKHNEAGSVAI